MVARLQTVVEEIVGGRAVASAAEARVLALAVHYVDLHPVTDVDGPARPEGPDRGLLGGLGGGEIAGEGTPAVADYAVEALGAALDVPYGHAWSLVADSVALCYRLPQLWARLQDGRMPVWRARTVARETTRLSRHAAGFVDRQLAILVDRRRWPSTVKLRDLVHEAALLDDPDHERAVEEAALDSRGVWFDHHTDTASTSVTSLSATLDAFDALDLDAALSDLADTMGRLGDRSSHDTRRAAALGLVAHPQRLLDLSTGTLPTPEGRGPDGHDADSAPTTPAVQVQPVSSSTENHALDLDGVPAEGEVQLASRSTLHLYVHASLTDLAALTLAASDPTETEGQPRGYALVERFGPAALDVVGRWADRCGKIVIRPVLDPTSSHARLDPDRGPGITGGTPSGLDPAATTAVDRHDPPEAMREHVILRDGACVFPGCQTDARLTDLDHIDPYVDVDPDLDSGPPAQTHPDNLACLCRRHHRLKTLTAWDYVRLDDGSYRWTDPAGGTYRTHPLPRRAALV